MRSGGDGVKFLNIKWLSVLLLFLVLPGCGVIAPGHNREVLEITQVGTPKRDVESQLILFDDWIGGSCMSVRHGEELLSRCSLSVQDDRYGKSVWYVYYWKDVYIGYGGINDGGQLLESYRNNSIVAQQEANAPSSNTHLSSSVNQNPQIQSIPIELPKGRRVALVIGNNDYSTGRLKNPLNDSKDIASTLQRLGFTIFQSNNTSLRDMKIVINQFHASLLKGGVGVFYYAGHGIQVDGRNYLVPTDAVINSESDVEYECVDAGRILGKMEDAGNAMNIVILDACRNNPFARSFRSSSRGLVRMDAPTGSILAYSTAPGDVAADGSGRNGIYTKHLLRHMMTPGLDINSVFIRTRMDVIQETNGRQVPWESSSLTGLFYFAGQESRPTQ